MAGVLAAIEGEFVVSRARLPRVTPFPSWNGVLACSGSDSENGNLVSVMSECGRVYLLRLNAPHVTAFEFEASLTVEQILESETGAVMSMWHAWTRRGHVLVVARDRQLTLYARCRRDDVATTDTDTTTRFVVVSTVVLRFAATSLDVLEDAASGDLSLAVASAAGVSIYKARADGTAVAWTTSLLDDVAVAIVAFAPDGHSLAVGTIDGRVIILRRRADHTFSSVESTAETYSKVLAAPRVTSVAFSPSSDTLVVTTRKGNAYVFTRDQDARTWTQNDALETLVANPKGGAASQTLSCWWGRETTDAVPIFTIAGRSASCSLEMYDVYSRSLLHTLTLSTTRPADTDASYEQNDAAAGRHLMGVVCVPSSTPDTPPLLLCIDSDACMSIIQWPFLAVACPR